MKVASVFVSLYGAACMHIADILACASAQQACVPPLFARFLDAAFGRTNVCILTADCMGWMLSVNADQQRVAVPERWSSAGHTVQGPQNHLSP